MHKQIQLVDTTTKQRMEMTHLKLQINIANFMVETQFDMTFINHSNLVREGELNLPLNQGCTICGYALDIYGRMVDGVIVERKRGREAFETTGGMNSCGMIEHTIGNVFKTRIYPFLPNSSRTVRVKTIEDMLICTHEDCYKLEYHFPVNVRQLDSLDISIEISMNSVHEPHISSDVLGDLLFIKTNEFRCCRYRFLFLCNLGCILQPGREHGQ
eukprot:TRINITY_DN3681_c0_g5_i2.p1 TRINITY_DN3681_c0_g5~~TRINITY_DN3681_c0_g5_i2.p1  ORF type:complete len:214 (-),score=37.86 TRINITY_DN3681_c0_g5_i2:474-1115(-)